MAVLNISKKILLALLLVLGFMVKAQELKVVEFRADMSMTDAVQYPKEDFNGDRCGLIRLGLVLPEAIFEGDIISSEYKEGEWWIYLVKDANWLTIKSKNYVPLRYEFEGIKSNVTYIMTVVPSTDSNGKPLPTQQYLAFIISPPNATLEVNDELWSVDADGSSKKYVDFGTYTYRVRASDYFTEEGKARVDDPKNTKLVSVTLKPNFAQVTLKVDADAEIWINDEKKGVRTWTGPLGKGTYKIECRQDGHETTMISKEITNDMNGQTIILPVPKPIYGSLNVESTPVGATIFIDGKKEGETPKSINEILIGKHEIRLIKNGFAEYTENVTIVKGERKEVKAMLIKKAEDTQPVATIPSNEQSDLTFTVGGVSFTMKLVEGGTFRMGATSEQGSEADINEKPVHSVTLSSYYIGETEVTQAFWQEIMGTTVSQQHDKANTSRPLRGEGGNYPMYYVSWNECQEFLSKLNQRTGKDFRLPTEAEWEYAARGGKKSKGYKYAGSNNIGSVAWYDDNSGSKTHLVKGKSPNELGLYDMIGNVWEWCQDWNGSDYYGKSPSTNPQGPSSGSYRVLRGGSWFDNLARSCRVSHRHYYDPDYGNSFIGFRLCLPL